MDSFIITCEHGRNRIPAPYRRLFREKRARLRFAPCDYVGIELEVSQGMVFAAGRRWTALRHMLIDSLRTARERVIAS